MHKLLVYSNHMHIIIHRCTLQLHVLCIHYKYKYTNILIIRICISSNRSSCAACRIIGSELEMSMQISKRKDKSITNHLEEVCKRGHADAVAMADILHYRRMELPMIRESVRQHGIEVRIV